MEDNTNIITADALIRRAELYLEDKEWDQATEYYQKALDANPESAKAYIGLVLAANNFISEEELAHSEYGFEANKHFEKALRFASPEYKEKLIEYDAENRLYRANSILANASTADDYSKAKDLLISVKDKHDVEGTIEDCAQKEKELREKSFSEETDRLIGSGTAEGLRQAATMFEERDPEKYAERIEELRNQSAKLEAADKAKRKKKKTIIIISIAAAILIPVIILLSFRIAASVRASKIRDNLANVTFKGTMDTDDGFYYGYTNNSLDNSKEYWWNQSEVEIYFMSSGLAELTVHEKKTILAYPSYYYTKPKNVDETYSDLYDYDVSVTLGGDVFLTLTDSYSDTEYVFEVDMDSEYPDKPWWIGISIDDINCSVYNMSFFKN